MPPSPFKPQDGRNQDEEDRARKIAMRKVRARLLKFNELFEDDKEGDSDG